ncbi:galactoside alpha-(1,2)-fucosyltransferase 2-like [Rhinoraja longicauda]
MKHRIFILILLSVTLVFITIVFQYKYKANIDYFKKSTNEKCVQSSVQNIPKGIWTINSAGRLGNQMGEFASLYALAKINGHQAYILPSMANYLSPVFKTTLPTLHESLVNKLPFQPYGLHDWMAEEYRNIPGNYRMLQGFPCSWTFFHHLREEILREFTFHDFITEETNAYLRRIGGERKNVTFVGVHVRRGDYVGIMPLYKGVVADKGYLEKAMGYFRDKYRNVIFVVTSDGIDWCKQNINNSKRDVFFSDTSKSPGEDLSILAHCNHTIITLGTFGFWAAYLAGGDTVYLVNYTTPDSRSRKIFKYETFYLPQWIGIAADLSPVLAKILKNNH